MKKISPEKPDILYVDDEQSNLEVFRISFKRGYNVWITTSPSEAFELLKNNPIQIVIADQQMPEMKGTEFLKRVSELYPDTIRIILTGYADIQVVMEAINSCGIYKYVTKPWEREDLQMTIEKAFETYRVKKENDWLIGNLEKSLEEIEQKYFQQFKEAKEYARKLEKQREVITSINQKNLQSILCASKIQQSLLPKQYKILNFFQDFFEIYAPLDIVSGDFYWFARTSPTEAYLAAVDCTGHGVPGALMSIIGHNELNKAIKEKKLQEPAEILEFIHQEVSDLFNDENTPDGMDIALCKFQKMSDNTYRMTFSGAKRPVYILQNGVLVEILGSRKSIGNAQVFVETLFQQHQIDLYKNDQIYLFTDGWTDVANDERKKFGYKRLKELILNTHNFTAEEQKIAMMQYLAEFKQDTPQRDDLFLISVRL
jgi:serine phosphatase RsbU (regulator of sigma subunit)